MRFLSPFCICNSTTVNNTLSLLANVLEDCRHPPHLGCQQRLLFSPSSAIIKNFRHCPPPPYINTDGFTLCRRQWTLPPLSSAPVLRDCCQHPLPPPSKTVTITLLGSCGRLLPSPSALVLEDCHSCPPPLLSKTVAVTLLGILKDCRCCTP